MKYLLDTHSLLWLSSGDVELSKNLIKDFKNKKNIFYLSMASVWELSIKISLRKLYLPLPLEQFIKSEVLGNEIEILPLKLDHFYIIEKLPFHHRDPFDRLLIAQAILENLIIYSKDSNLKKYPAKLKW